MIKGFIFDLDGVIADTAEYHYQSWKRLAEEEGVLFSRRDYDALRGLSRENSLQIFARGHELDPAAASDWMDRKNRYFHEVLGQMGPHSLLPGVRSFLEQSREAGIKLGVGSGSRNARQVMRLLQTADFFDVVGDGYVIANSKPAVDLFMWVAGGLGLLPAECVVFEDAEAGIEAALLAGMRCVGIGPQERVGKANLVCAGLHELTVDQVLRLGENP